MGAKKDRKKAQSKWKSVHSGWYKWIKNKCCGKKKKDGAVKKFGIEM